VTSSLHEDIGADRNPYPSNYQNSNPFTCHFNIRQTIIISNPFTCHFKTNFLLISPAGFSNFLQGIMGITDTSGANALLSGKLWGEFFTKTPCVRQSFLIGVGTASLVFAHKLRVYPGRKNLHKAINALLLTFSIITPVNFVFCANQFNSRHKALKEAFAQQNIKPQTARRE